MFFCDQSVNTQFECSCLHAALFCLLNPGSLSHSECSSPSLITPPQSPLNLETSSFASSQSQGSISTLPRISVSPVPIGERRKDRYVGKDCADDKLMIRVWMDDADYSNTAYSLILTKLKLANWTPLTDHSHRSHTVFIQSLNDIWISLVDTDNDILYIVYWLISSHLRLIFSFYCSHLLSCCAVFNTLCVQCAPFCVPECRQ